MICKNFLYKFIKEQKGEILFDSREEKLFVIKLKGEEIYFKIIDGYLKIDGELKDKKLLNVIKYYLSN